MLIVRNRAQAILYEYARQFLRRDKMVLIPSNTCESIPMAYQKAGIPFEMIDIDWISMSMDLAEAEKRVQQMPGRYQAIHYVYNYGVFRKEDREKLLTLKKTYGLKIIEDKCLCMPDVSFDESRSVNSDIEVYSTGHCKCVDVEKGGYAYVDEQYASAWRYFKEPFQADILKRVKEAFKKEEVIDWKHLSSLNWLEDSMMEEEEAYKQEVRRQYSLITEKKKRLNDIYRSMIPGQLCMPDIYHSWRFQVLLTNAGEVEAKIFQTEGLFASRHYRVWGNGLFSKECFPVAERVAAHIVNLFNDGYYTEEKAVKTAEIIRECGKVYE